MKQENWDVVVIGGGPAGLAAGIYASRANLRTVIIEKLLPGGYLLSTEEIENYPGFIRVQGADLATRMEKQTRFSGAVIRIGTANEIRSVDSEWLVRTEEGDEYRAPAIIYCTGGSPRKLNVPGEAEFSGRGVSYCAVCDGPLFHDQVIAVVGGGDSAVGEGIYLARFGKKVHILNNDDDLEASPVLQERAFTDPKIEVHFNSLVEQIGGTEKVEWVRIRNPKDGSVSTLDVGGVFIYIGFWPNSDLLRGKVKLDERGYIITDWRMRTSAPGIFAAGDVTAYTVRQITNAVADGTTAALQAYEYIQEQRAPTAIAARRVASPVVQVKVRKKKAA